MSGRGLSVAESKRTIDDLGDAELFRELVAFFGSQRLIELLGWAVVGALVSGFTGDSPAELRRKMEDRGFTAASFYRALRDLRRFGEYIEQRPYPSQDHTETLVIARRLSKIQVV